MTQENNYKGFALFNDVEDRTLRNRNRAVVLSNIAEDNTRNKRISPKGASLILGYFSTLPAEERGMVQVLFSNEMIKKGFALG